MSAYVATNSLDSTGSSATSVNVSSMSRAVTSTTTPTECETRIRVIRNSLGGASVPGRAPPIRNQIMSVDCQISGDWLRQADRVLARVDDLRSRTRLAEIHARRSRLRAWLVLVVQDESDD